MGNRLGSMVTETGTAGDNDASVTVRRSQRRRKRAVLGGGSRVTAKGVPAAVDATRREEPTVNQGKMITSEDQAGLGD